MDTKDIALMRHALGLDQSPTSYRNHYAAAVGSEEDRRWANLVITDLAEHAGGTKHLAMFRVTKAGRRALAEAGET